MDHPIVQEPTVVVVGQEQRERCEQDVINEASRAETASMWVVGRCAQEWCENYARGRTQQDFAELIGCSQSKVSRCIRIWEQFSQFQGIVDLPARQWRQLAGIDGAAATIQLLLDEEREPTFENIDRLNRIREGDFQERAVANLPESVLPSGATVRNEARDFDDDIPAIPEYAPFKTGQTKPPPVVTPAEESMPAGIDSDNEQTHTAQPQETLSAGTTPVPGYSVTQRLAILQSEIDSITALSEECGQRVRDFLYDNLLPLDPSIAEKKGVPSATALQRHFADLVRDDDSWDQQLSALICDWIDTRQALLPAKRIRSIRQLERAVEQCKVYHTVAREALDEAITGGYQGLFFDKHKAEHQRRSGSTVNGSGTAPLRLDNLSDLDW